MNKNDASQQQEKSEADSFKRQEVLFIKYWNCPDVVRNIMFENYRCHPNTYMEHISELSPSGEADQCWGNTLTMARIESYYKGQCKDNNYAGNLENFIESYNLIIDRWLISTGYDFSGIKKILFEM